MPARIARRSRCVSVRSVSKAVARRRRNTGEAINCRAITATWWQCANRERVSPVGDVLAQGLSSFIAWGCVRLELRSLPSPGVTRLQRYYEPLRLPTAPGLSLAGVRLIIPDHVVGPPVLRTLSLCTCCRHYPGAASGRFAR